MSTADNLLELSIGDSLRSGRAWFNAIRERAAELVQQAARSDDTPMNTGGAGASFAPPSEGTPSRAEARVTKLAKAKAVLHRASPTSGRQLTVHCPRHGRGFSVDLTVTIGHDGWMLNAVPAGCDHEDHDWTPDERMTLADRIDEALDAGRQP